MRLSGSVRQDVNSRDTEEPLSPSVTPSYQTIFSNLLEAPVFQAIHLPLLWDSILFRIYMRLATTQIGLVLPNCTASAQSFFKGPVHIVISTSTTDFNISIHLHHSFAVFHIGFGLSNTATLAAIMDPIILPSPIRYAPFETPQYADKSGSTRPRLASFSATRDSSIPWGRRAHHGSWPHALGCASIMTLCPLLVVFYWVALTSFQASLPVAWQVMWTVGPVSFFWSHAPRADYKVYVAYGSYLLYQAGLYHLLPGKLSVGQLTPAGHLLKYRTNGLIAWILTHVLFGVSVLHGSVDPAIIARHWESLLVSANVFGFAFSVFVFIKAYVFPTHEGDRKFSGKFL